MNLRFNFCRIACFPVLFIVALFAAAPTFAAESRDTNSRSIVYLDFQYKNYNNENWPKDWRTPNMEIALDKDPYFGSAFLRELKRQSVLIAARDELGAITRDEFLGEVVPEEAPENVVKIEDTQMFFKDVDDFDTLSRELDYPEILARCEKYSRNEFVQGLKSRNVKKIIPEIPGNESDDTIEREKRELEKLLQSCALIPNFNALRRVHTRIRDNGETYERLENLVRAYTQMQILTNAMPRDTHRVFQARALLYAQRAVAKYGNENPEAIMLRAAAWSYCNFHKIARDEFTLLVKDDTIDTIDEIFPDAWTRLAFRYANFSVKEIEKEFETLNKQTQRPFARLLHYILLSYTEDGRFSNGLQSRQDLGQQLIIDLPHCERLFHGTPPHWIYYMRPPNEHAGQFYDRALREIAPAIRGFEKCPQTVSKAALELQRFAPKTESGGIAGLLRRNRPRNEMPQKINLIEFLPAMGKMLHALRDTTPENDPQELSFQAIATILEDEQFSILLPFTTRKQWYENHDGLVRAAEQAVASHPFYAFLGLQSQNQDIQKKFRDMYKEAYKNLPFEALSQSFPVPWFFDRSADSGYMNSEQVACCFADRKNVRDLSLYNRNAIQINPNTAAPFCMDLLYDLCPNNPYAAIKKLEKSDPLDEPLAKRCEDEFLDYWFVRNSLFEMYNKRNDMEKMQTLFQKFPSGELAQKLSEHCLKQYDMDKAADVLKKFLALPEAKSQGYFSECSARLGYIISLQGKTLEALPYMRDAAAMNQSYTLSLSNFYETLGDFEKAEEIVRKSVEQSPDNVMAWFSVCYRTQHQHMVYALDKVFEQYEAKKKNPNAPGNIDHDTMVSVLRSLDANMEDYEELVGKKPDIIAFFETGTSVSGLRAYFDAIENKNEKKAQTLLKLLLWQRQLIPPEEIVRLKNETEKPNMKDQQKNIEEYQVLSAIFALDQLSEKPGNLKPEEIDFLIHRSYIPAISGARPLWLLYLTGQYFELCREHEKAAQTYRRILGIRVVVNPHTRNFAVQGLRKHGLTREEYLDAIMTDPKIPTYPISMTWPDQICRQLFREFSPTPLETVLAKPVAENIVQNQENEFGEPGNFDRGYYRTTKILFRGEEIPEHKTIIHWNITPQGTWNSLGTAFSGPIPVKVDSRNEKAYYPVRLGTESDSLLAHAYFYGGKMVLLISLDENREPDSPFPAPESNCVRIEMKKLK